MTDDALIKRCQNGDSNAFEALLEHYYDTIYRFAYRWCNDQTNAQDITQLVCMKLAKSVHQFKFESSFSTWLYPLVINCAKDFYKSPSQHNTREQQQYHLASLDKTSDDIATRQIYAQQILEHINTLQDDLKETLILIYGKGLNHRQAADTLNVKESTISWRVHEARKLLKQTFNSSGLSNNDITSAESTRGLA